MKKLIAACCLWMVVAVCSAGCSSIITTSETLSRKEVAGSVAEDESRREEDRDGVRLNYSDEDRKQQVPDYFKQNMEEKFKELGGKQAFRIKEDHSDDSSDVEGFQIADMVSDGTFLYGYTTSVRNMENTMVHCAAFYNYKTEQFQPFHENRFHREGLIPADGESFFLQHSDDEVFIYDNGFAYLYEMNGRLKAKSDIEAYLRSQYPDAHSINVTNALTDGNSRIYLEISVEHEELQLPATFEQDRKTEEELDEEAEELDDEVSEKVSDFILVYEVTTLDTTMFQDKENFEIQKRKWREMTNGKEFTSEPDEETDWNAVVKSNPDQWGCAAIWVKQPGWLSKRENVYQWKAHPAFQNYDEIVSFIAFPGTYRYYTALTGGADLRSSRLFAPINGKFSILNGQLGTHLFYTVYESISRTYTHVTYTTSTDEEGNETETKNTETITQTISKPERRYRNLESAFTETYRVLDPDKVHMLGNCVDGKVLCSGDDDFYFAQPDGDLEKICSVDEDEGYLGGILKDGSLSYMVLSGRNKMYVSPIDEDGETDPEDGDRLLFFQLGGGYTSGNTVYDRAFERVSTSDGMDMYNGAELFTEKHLIKTGISVNPGLARELYDAGVSVLGLPNGGYSQGYLITSLNRGLIFCNPDSFPGTVLAEGCWYRSFENGDKIISIGFANGDNSYSSMDMAFARVYEYNLNELCRSSMESALEEIRRQEEERSEPSGEGMVDPENERETVKSMEEHWNEDYKNLHTEVAPETAMSAGETFDAEEFEANAAVQKANEESSRAARIDEILYGTGAEQQ